MLVAAAVVVGGPETALAECDIRDADFEGIVEMGDWEALGCVVVVAGVWLTLRNRSTGCCCRGRLLVEGEVRGVDVPVGFRCMEGVGEGDGLLEFSFCLMAFRYC